MENLLDKEMLAYFIRLNEAEKKSVVQMLKTFLTERNNKFSRISIEQYNLELEEAMKEIQKGETFTHEEVVKMSEKW
jgi:hypothetical protein